MNALDTVRNEFNLSLENFAEAIVYLQHSLESLTKRVSRFLEPQSVTGDTVEMTVKGDLKASHFESVMDIVRVSKGIQKVFLYVPRNQYDEKLRMIAGSGFHVGGSKVEDGVCYLLLRRNL